MTLRRSRSHARGRWAPRAWRRGWLGLGGVVLRDSAAFQLPELLPVRSHDRLLVVGGPPALGAMLAARAALQTPPVHVGTRDRLHDAAPPPGTEVLAAAVTALPFPAASFTVVVVPHGIRAWDDARLLAFLREAWRVLTHNGIVVLWEVAPSRSGRVNAVWQWLLGEGASPVRLRPFAAVGELGREAGFAWVQTLRLRPFLAPPGPRLAMLLRKEHYTPDTIHLGRGETPA